MFGLLSSDRVADTPLSLALISFACLVGCSDPEATMDNDGGSTVVAETQTPDDSVASPPTLTSDSPT